MSTLRLCSALPFAGSALLSALLSALAAAGAELGGGPGGGATLPPLPLPLPLGGGGPDGGRELCARSTGGAPEGGPGLLLALLALLLVSELAALLPLSALEDDAAAEAEATAPGGGREPGRPGGGRIPPAALASSLAFFAAALSFSVSDKLLYVLPRLTTLSKSTSLRTAPTHAAWPKGEGGAPPAGDCSGGAPAGGRCEMPIPWRFCCAPPANADAVRECPERWPAAGPAAAAAPVPVAPAPEAPGAGGAPGALGAARPAFGAGIGGDCCGSLVPEKLCRAVARNCAKHEISQDREQGA